MTLRNRITWAALALLACGVTADAGIALDERFDDGGFTNGADPIDAAWYRRSTLATLSVVTDNTIGSGNALLTDRAVIATTQVTMGTFGGVTMGQGRIQFDFDFRITNLNDSGTTVFRWGIYQSVGPQIAADGSNAADNDKGYQFAIRYGAFAPVMVVGRDNGLATTAAPTYGVTGVTTLLNTSTPPTAINFHDTNRHHITTLFEQVSGGVNITVIFDGITRFTLLDTSPITSFDFVAFATDFTATSNADFVLDNVLVTTPEPGTAAAVVLAGLPWVSGRRRRAA